MQQTHANIISGSVFVRLARFSRYDDFDKFNSLDFSVRLASGVIGDDAHNSHFLVVFSRIRPESKKTHFFSLPFGERERRQMETTSLSPTKKLISSFFSLSLTLFRLGVPAKNPDSISLALSGSTWK